MRKILVIGIGAGHPDHLTLEAVEALKRARVVFIPDKGEGKEDLRQLRHAVCERFVATGATRIVTFEVPVRESGPDGYRRDVEAWHGRIVDRYEALLRGDLAEGEAGAFLVWGDPSLYDSTLRILDALAARGGLPFGIEVIPGISSVQVLAARHRIALNRIGEPVHITTGRRLAEDLATCRGDMVVMLDGEQAFAHLDRDDLDIYWGAYLGTEDEILVAGRLVEVKGEIVRLRARARQAKGWIMDTYLLRRRGEP